MRGVNLVSQLSLVHLTLVQVFQLCITFASAVRSCFTQHFSNSSAASEHVCLVERHHSSLNHKGSQIRHTPSLVIGAVHKVFPYLNHLTPDQEHTTHDFRLV